MSFAVSGVNCAAATPLNADFSPDLPRFADHCRRLIADGCDGIALLGTTGEANSFSLPERRAILEAALGADIAPDRLLPGIGTPAVPDTVALARHALSLGVTRVVMLPPYYYKGVSDDGLFAAYARIIDEIADDRLRIILYHIPQVSGVGITHPLITRLIASYPRNVVGIKDSSGDLANMQSIAAAHPGFAVLAGADPLLLPMLRSGGAGCITAVANVAGPQLRTIYDGHADPERAEAVEAAQRAIVAWRELANAYQLQLATVKAMLAIREGHDGWRRVRPPLDALSEAETAELAERMAALG